MGEGVGRQSYKLGHLTPSPELFPSLSFLYIFSKITDSALFLSTTTDEKYLLDAPSQFYMPIFALSGVIFHFREVPNYLKDRNTL